MSPSQEYLLSIANEVIPTLPATLLNIFPFPCTLSDLLRIFSREFKYDNLEHGERIAPYIYLNHAYDVTNNDALKPLLDYFKPIHCNWNREQDVFMNALAYFNKAKDADYLPTNILELHGFTSLEEVSNVIYDAFNENPFVQLNCKRLHDVRGYINDANVICEATLNAFTQQDYYEDYESVAPHIFKRRRVYQPLLFYIDFVLRENAINRFREMFYALKYKQRFRDLLWVKVREPKIRARYHPDNLAKMLEGRDDMGLDELDALMDQW